MTISVLLMKQIVSMILTMGCGYALVKAGLLKAEESHTISVLTIYVIFPCSVVNAFRIPYTPQIRNNFLLALAAAVLAHVLMIAVCRLLRAPLRLRAEDCASIIYPNCANLILPLVSSVLGEEWVIYSSAYICVQILFIWTHGLSLIYDGAQPVRIRKIMTNPNLIAAAVGLVLFLFSLPLPSVVDTTLSNISKAIGPVSIIMIGMLLSTYDLREILANSRILVTVALRMLFFPALMLLVFKFSPLASLTGEGTKVLLISLLAISAPSAISVTQMAQLAGADARYAGLINAATTLVCVITMPLIVFLYLA